MLVAVNVVVFVTVFVCVVDEVLVPVVVVNSVQTVSDVEVHAVEMYCAIEHKLHTVQTED